jgi:hypothetical protein
MANREHIEAVLNGKKAIAKWREENPDTTLDLSDANLSGANLFDANLSRVNLSRADLSDANLFRADLFEANLSGANLSDAKLSYANLSRADLSGANLSDANLSGANLSGANFSGAKFSPEIEALRGKVKVSEVFEIISEEPLRLQMEAWHHNSSWAKDGINDPASCGCVHCMCGWAIHIAAYKYPEMNVLAIEEKISSHLLGHVLLGDKATSHFFDSNESAFSWMKSQVAPS